MIGKMIGALTGQAATPPARKAAGAVTVARLREISAGWFSGRMATPESALMIPAVLCAVRVIAEGMAQSRLSLVETDTTGPRTVTRRLVDHPAARLVARPNRFQTAFEFVEHAVICAALTGDFLAVKLRAGGVIRELIPVIPSAWSTEFGGDGRLYYVITAGAGARPGRYAARDVLHLRGPSWNQVRGLAVVRQAAEALGLAGDLEKMQGAAARTGLRPPGVIEVQEALSQAATDELVAEWEARFGENGSGGLLVLDSGGKFVEVSGSSADAETVATREFQIKEIARAFRVFPQMLMADSATATFGAAEQFFIAHVVHTLKPWGGRFAAVLDRDLLHAEGDVRPGLAWGFDLDELTRGTARDRAEADRVYWNMGAKSPNEIRQAIGLDPYEGGDEYRVPLNTESAGQDADGPGNDQKKQGGQA